MDNIVLDTNCLVASLSRRKKYYRIWHDFMIGKFTLCISNEILTEYEEILTQKMGAEIANNVIVAILARKNTKQVEVYYRFNLIQSDPDDNKFVDCAVKTNAKYIVTEDHHFNELKNISFPSVEHIGIEDFYKSLLDT